MTALTVLEFAGYVGMLTQATFSRMRQGRQQGGVEAVVDGKASTAQVQNGGSGVSRMGWGAGARQLVLTAWSEQTEQPRHHQGKMDESPRLQGWNFRHGR